MLDESGWTANCAPSTVAAMPSDSAASSTNSPLLVLGKISAILDSFTLGRPVLKLAHIREATGMPTSTVQRLVTNLVAKGFLDRDDDAYRIGLKLAHWAAPATRGLEMLDLMRPLLKDLRDATGETACFFKAEGNYRVCVAMAETNHALRREMHVGKIIPVHAGSAGRVLLAWDNDLLHATLNSSLESLTDSTITSPPHLESAARQTRSDGFAITIGEREDGASGLSAPVFDASTSLVGAVTISGPTLRMPLTVCEGWVEILLETAERMTRLIGGRYPHERKSQTGSTS